MVFSHNEAGRLRSPDDWCVIASVLLVFVGLSETVNAGQRKGMNIGEAKLWDVEHGKEKARFAGFKEQATCVAFALDGSAIAVAGHGEIVLFDAGSGKRLTEFAENDKVRSMVFSARGNLLAAAYSGGAINLFNLRTGKHSTLRSEWYLRTLTLASNDATVVTGGGHGLANPGKVEFWNSETGQRLGELDFPEMVAEVAVSRDGKFLVVAGGRGALKLYDWETKKESFPIEGQAPVAFSWDSKFLVTNSSVRDPEIRIWELATGKKKFAFRLGYIHYPAALAISPNGKIIATGGTDDEKMLSLWDAETGKEIRRITDTKVPIESLAFSPDGKLLASAGWTRKFIREGEEGQTEQTPRDSDGWLGVLVFGGSIAIIAALLGVIALVRRRRA